VYSRNAALPAEIQALLLDLGRAWGNYSMAETPDDPVIIAKMEEYGEQQMRLLMASGGWPTQLNPVALRWLSKKEQESRRLNEASQASQMRTALSAQKAAWIAAIAAIAAAVTAIIGTIITYLAWLWPHQ
jgi:hypothetical protein